MWIISFLPDFVPHLIVLLGILGIIITSVPLVWRLLPGASAYQLVIQLFSVALLGFGLYLEGGLSNEASWKAKVAALELKVAKAEAKAAQINTVIETEYVTKKQIIKQKGDTITEYIDREVIKYDTSCPIPDSVIKSHNAAASGDLSLLTPTTEISTDPFNAAARPMVLPKK